MKKAAFLLSFFLITLQTLFAEGGEEILPARDQGMWQTVVMVGIALAFFYVIMWRPEQKKRKALEEQRSSLKKGDRVTAMGIIGTVAKEVKPQDQTIILKMYDGTTKIEFLKGAISNIIGEEDKKDGKEEPLDKDK